MARKRDWFLSTTGRKFSFGLTCAATVSCIAAKILPNVFFIDKYQELLSSYRNGFPVPVAKHVKQRFDKVLNILELPEIQRRCAKPFTIIGFEIFSAGSLLSKWGAIFGIPENYSYVSKDSIDRRRIQVNNEPVNWNLPEAEQLLDALVLSENAQIFAMAREVEEKRTFKFLLDTSFPPFVILGMYGFAQYYNEKLNFYARPRSLRLMFYTLIGIFGAGLYSFLKDFTQNSYDAYLDKTLAEKDLLFVYGGLEYYQKIVERNKALRTLLGKAGEKKYTVYGNENFFIRQKCLPVVVRKMYFETKLLELSKTGE